jgi:phosphinothricin acetyltransferase
MIETRLGPVLIRPADLSDSQAIRAISAWYIEQTPFSWRYVPLTPAESERWLARHLARPAHRVWVAEHHSCVIGYSCLSDFRAPEGYWPCAENTIYVRQDFNGCGIGSVLMRRILEQAQANDLTAVVAAIDSTNVESIRFHRRFAFMRCGYLARVAWKNGQWRDLVLMQYTVPGEPADPAAQAAAEVARRGQTGL